MSMTAYFILRVLAVGAAVTAAFFAARYAPGPSWLYYLLAALLIAAVDRALVHWTLDWVGRIVPPVKWVLEYWQRTREYREVLGKMNLTLKELKQPTLDDARLDRMASAPPVDAKNDVRKCCKRFAAHTGHSSLALELLYRYLLHQTTKEIWSTLVPKGLHADVSSELAEVLAKSGKFDEFDDLDDTRACLRWVLGRSEEFRRDAVHADVRDFAVVYRRLKSFANWVAASDRSETSAPSVAHLQAAIDASGRTPGTELLDTAAGALVGESKRLVSEWADKNDRSCADVDCEGLAVVSLGVFTIHAPPIGFRLLERLASEVAHAGAGHQLEILFGHLWSISRRGAAADPRLSLDRLADWKASTKSASEELGSSLCDELAGALLSLLQKHDWPTWLPFNLVASRFVHGYEQLERLSSAEDKGTHWRQQAKRLISQMDVKIDGTAETLDPALLVERVKSAADEKLRALIPEGLETTRTAKAVADQLALFADRTFRPEPPVPSGEVPPGELRDMLEVEATGGCAYVITFGETRGHVADLVDSVKGKYGFHDYTQSARIGRLRSGQRFEDFYKELWADLTTLFKAALDEDLEGLMELDSRIGADEEKLRKVKSEIERTRKETGPDWENVEITVQQVSLLRCHDFTRHVAERLPAVHRRIFRTPSSSLVFLTKIPPWVQMTGPRRWGSSTDESRT